MPAKNLVAKRVEKKPGYKTTGVNEEPTGNSDTWRLDELVCEQCGL